MGLTVAARATVTIEFVVNTNWTEEHTMAQIEKDASQDAVRLIQKGVLIHNNPVNIIGDPQIRVVLVQRDR